jgi:hypothetical protein
VRDGHPLHLHPQSVLFKAPPQHVVFHEVLITNKECAPPPLPRAPGRAPGAPRSAGRALPREAARPAPPRAQRRPAAARYMRDITTIDHIWLAELAPHFYSFKNKNIKVKPQGDPDAVMFEEGTHKRRKIGPVLERLT